MERFTPDELLFEIPVYRSSPEERLRETDDLIAGVQEHADALAVDLPGQREVAEGYREARERVVRRSLRPFLYNEMIGVIRLYQDGGSIKGELWRQPHQRFRRDWVHHAYQPWTRVVEYAPAFGPETSIEVYEALLEWLVELPTGGTLNGRYVDLHAFRRVGPHIDWLAVLGWQMDRGPEVPSSRLHRSPSWAAR
jgi:hypothetical protein